MRKKVIAENPGEPKAKGKPGRKPMTPEEREAAAAVRAVEKQKAENMKPHVLIQYQDIETDMAALIEAAKADFHSRKKRTLVTDMKLYIKPEERAAYYVINETYTGKISF